MPIIKKYDIFVKGDKNEFMTVNQLEGQKIILLLCKANRPEYVVINGNCLSLNMISAIKQRDMRVWRDGIIHECGDKRELTEDEAKVEKLFNEIQGKKLMLN